MLFLCFRAFRGTFGGLSGFYDLLVEYLAVWRERALFGYFRALAPRLGIARSPAELLVDGWA